MQTAMEFAAMLTTVHQYPTPTKRTLISMRPVTRAMFARMTRMMMEMETGPARTRITARLYRTLIKPTTTATE
jgi:hypothetical protein